MSLKFTCPSCGTELTVTNAAREFDCPSCGSKVKVLGDPDPYATFRGDTAPAGATAPGTPADASVEEGMDYVESDVAVPASVKEEDDEKFWFTTWWWHFFVWLVFQTICVDEYARPEYTLWFIGDPFWIQDHYANPGLELPEVFLLPIAYSVFLSAIMGGIAHGIFWIVITFLRYLWDRLVRNGTRKAWLALFAILGLVGVLIYFMPDDSTDVTWTPGMEEAKRASDAGQYADAVRLYTAELAKEEAKVWPSWGQLAHLNNQLGTALDDTGQYDQALEFHQKSLAIKLKQLDADHADVAMSYNRIGNVYHSKGEDDQALEYHLKSLAIKLKQLGPDHPDVAISYNNIGNVYHAKGEYDQALEYHLKSLAIELIKQLDPDHPNVAASYNNIGNVYTAKGKYDHALEFHQKALAIDLKTKSKDHPDITRSYNNIAFVYKAKKNLLMARAYYGKVYAIRLEKLGPDHPNARYTKNKLDEITKEMEKK